MEPCSVKYLLGIAETDLVRLSPAEKKRLLVTSGDGRLGFKHTETKKFTPCGLFSLPSLDELRGTVSSSTTEAPPAVCESEGIEVDGESTKTTGGQNAGRRIPPIETLSKVDIGQFQGTLTSADAAMVQVASNFNCLENGGASTAPDCGMLVDGAVVDHTQGPAAVFAALSGYLYRTHFVHDGVGQRFPSPAVNLLSDVGNFFGTPYNGKLKLSGDEEPLPQDDEGRSAVAGRIRVGLHADVPILFSRDPDRRPKLYTVDPEPETKRHSTVDQLFTASINLHSFGKLGNNVLKAHDGLYQPAIQGMVRTLVRAAYEGTYLAAVARQRKQLYLTLVGGGVFGNPIPTIVEEIQRAHLMYAAHPASCLEKVVICLYSPADERAVLSAMKALPKLPQTMPA